MVKNSVILPRRVVPQPQPHINTGGDCGACVLGGIVGQSLDAVYKNFQPDEKTPTSFHWFSMRQGLHNGLHAGFFDRIIVDTPAWKSPRESMMQFGTPAWAQSLGWFAYLRMAMDAGYYGLAMVNFAKQGPWQSPDHWVLLCGTREIWPEDEGAINSEVLVSCSAKSTPAEEWVRVEDFLKERGGFNCFFARPLR